MNARTAVWVATVTVVGAMSVSCMDAVGDGEPGTAMTSQALDAAHTRVMQESSQAMTGSRWTYNATNWPTGTTFATYAYTSADAGAWNLLLDTPISNFTCQGSCSTATYKRGGQCKPFMNLVAYRSGLYQKPGYAWKSFPSDACIYYTTATCSLAASKRVARAANDADMPLATYANIVEGDYLRMPYDHAAIVVRKIDSLNVVVFDSNWVPGSSGTGNGKQKTRPPLSLPLLPSPWPF